jgi:uncharacterized protein YutE (UPF0331/DUF86 family)
MHEGRMLDFESRLDVWAQALDHSLERVQQTRTAQTPEHTEALFFNLERAAWACVELAQAWVFEAQLGLPKRPQDVFELLARAGWIGIDEARRLKQVSEHRTLSSREPGRVEKDYLLEALDPDLEVMSDWRSRALQWIHTPATKPAN